MVPNNEKLLEAFNGGLPRIIEGNVTASKPQTLEDAINISQRSPATASDCKTPIEVWSGKPANYSKLLVLSRDVTFDEDYLFYVKQDPIESKHEDGVFLKVEDVLKQVEHVVPGDTDNDLTSPDDHTNLPHLEHKQDRSIAYDRPRRIVKAPSRFEAITSKESDMWIMAMGEAIESLHKSNTWELVKLLKEEKLLVGIAHHNLKLEKLDVKTVFLHGDLEEEIYMSQPKGLVVQGKEDYVCKDIKEVNKLKILLNTEFDMKHLGATRKILGMEIIPDQKHDLDDRRSLTCYVFTIGNSVVSWKATLQPSVALCTTESEYMALTKAAKEGIWLKGQEVTASDFSHLNHSLSHRPIFVKPDISKPDISKASSVGGKLHILKPSCERNGITLTLKESLSPTSGSIDVRGDLDSGIGSHWGSSNSGPPHHDFSLMEILPGKSTRKAMIYASQEGQDGDYNCQNVLWIWPKLRKSLELQQLYPNIKKPTDVGEAIKKNLPKSAIIDGEASIEDVGFVAISLS
ncbi:retrovirus-related pol polyprotein from transposon TNT 1-94 [Tanacetum coccineum]